MNITTLDDLDVQGQVVLLRVDINSPIDRTTGKINDVSPFSCTHERMLFPIVDKAGNKLFKEKNFLFRFEARFPWG